MFLSNRARHDQGPDTPINHSTSAQSARAGPAEHRSGNSPSRQRGTMPHRALARSPVRSRRILLALAVLTLLGRGLVGTAAATSQDMAAPRAQLPSSTIGLTERLGQPTQTTQAGRTRDQRPVIPAGAEVRLELQPKDERILPGQSQGYTAAVVIRVGPRQADPASNPDIYRDTIDVTGWTRFSITKPGKCSKAAGKVSCTASKVGDYTVTGAFPQWPGHLIKGTATLTVVPGPSTNLKLAPPTAEIPAGA
jgi:hypothetical protein